MEGDEQLAALALVMAAEFAARASSHPPRSILLCRQVAHTNLHSGEFAAGGPSAASLKLKEPM
jgi:hypothetical protein